MFQKQNHFINKAGGITVAYILDSL